MREILFRGKSPVTKEWVYGDLFQHGEQRFIMTGGHNIEVDPESVGQFTGLTDKNGVKIFEGDKIKISEGNDEDDYVIRKVYAYRGVLCVDYWTPDWDFNALAFLDNDNGYVFEIIGNIYDNPELIEDSDDDEQKT